jgi:hypothetical protein
MSSMRAAALALCLAVASMSACSGKQGSSSVGDTGGSSGRLTKAQYIARGDAICKDMNEVPDKIAEPEDASDIGAVADYLQQSLDETRPKVDELEALQPPAGDQDVATRMNDTYDQLLAKEAEVIAAARARDNERYDQAQAEVKELTMKLSEEASAYGFEVCGT